MKTALFVILPLLVIMGYYTAAMYRHDRQLLHRNLEMQLLRIAEGIQGAAETLIARNDQPALQALATDAARGADVGIVMIIDARGRVVASSAEKWNEVSVHEVLNEYLSERDLGSIRKGLDGGYSMYFNEEDEQYCLAMPLAFGRHDGAALFLGLETGDLMAKVKDEALRNLLDLIALVILIGSSVYLFIYFFIIRRIQAVSAAATALAGGKLSVRVPAAGTDEIGCLGASFNVMAEDIANWSSNMEEMVTHRVLELSALYEVARIIAGSLELKTVLSEILDHVLETLGEQKGVIVLTGGDAGSLRVMAVKGLPAPVAETDAGCLEQAISTKEAVRIGSFDDGSGTGPAGMASEGVRSALVAPLTARGGVLGCLAVYSARNDRFTEQDEALLATIGSQVGVAVENAMLYESALELAREDGLTRLANRRYLMEQLQREVARSRRYNTALSLLMLDLDRFKQFNDTYGHIKGDELLRGVGSLLKSSIRATDIAGRFGGEEFCVILPNTSLSGALVIAERIRREIERLSVPVGDRASAGATVSIGAAEFTAEQNEENLLHAADLALYRAKQGGRNRVAC